MSFQKRYIDMLESKITDETTRSFFHISWDLAKQQYVFGLRVYFVEESQAFETIYLDFQTLGIIYQHLPEVFRLLSKFHNHISKPVKNYNEAYQLCNTSLNPIDRRNWAASEFEIAVHLQINSSNFLVLLIVVFIFRTIKRKNRLSGSPKFPSNQVTPNRYKSNASVFNISFTLTQCLSFIMLYSFHFVITMNFKMN